MARGANEAADDASVSSSVVWRADAHQMEDMLGTANHAHPIAGEESALRVADEDDLVRAGDHAHGADISIELLGGFCKGLGGATAVVRGEDRPAVLAQLIAEDLPYALGIAGAVDEDDWPGALCGGTRAPVIFKDAARLNAGTKGKGSGGIGVEGGIAGAGLDLLGFDEVRDFGRDLLAQCRGLGRGATPRRGESVNSFSLARQNLRSCSEIVDFNSAMVPDCTRYCRLTVFLSGVKKFMGKPLTILRKVYKLRLA